MPQQMSDLSWYENPTWQNKHRREAYNVTVSTPTENSPCRHPKIPQPLMSGG
jgi:hypothetical protein